MMCFRTANGIIRFLILGDIDGSTLHGVFNESTGYLMEHAEMLSPFIKYFDFSVQRIPRKVSPFTWGSPKPVAVLEPQIFHAVTVAWIWSVFLGHP